MGLGPAFMRYDIRSSKMPFDYFLAISHSRTTLHTALFAFGMTTTHGYIQKCDLVVGGGKCKRNSQRAQQLSLSEFSSALIKQFLHSDIEISPSPIYMIMGPYIP
jgi:hypothetical protein